MDLLHSAHSATLISTGGPDAYPSISAETTALRVPDFCQSNEKEMEEEEEGDLFATAAAV